MKKILKFTVCFLLFLIMIVIYFPIKVAFETIKIIDKGLYWVITKTLDSKLYEDGSNRRNGTEN